MNLHSLARSWQERSVPDFVHIEQSPDSMPNMYGPSLECRLSSTHHPACPWPSNVMEPVHAVSLVSPGPAPAQLLTAIDQLSSFVTVLSGTVPSLVAASLRQQQPSSTWQAVSTSPGDVYIDAPGSVHIGAAASSYSQLGLQGTCVGPAADPTYHIHLQVEQPPQTADDKAAKVWDRLQRLTTPITCLALHTRSGEPQPLPPSSGVTCLQQLALEQQRHTLQQQQVPLLTRQVLEGWCKGGAAGHACLQQLHEYLGALACGIGGVQWQSAAATAAAAAAADSTKDCQKGTPHAQAGTAANTSPQQQQVPQPLVAVSAVEVCSWRGLVAAPQVKVLAEACGAAVQGGGLPWAALVLNPFGHLPSRWSGSRQQLQEGWSTPRSQVLLVLQEGACCLMTSAEPRQILKQ